MVLTAFARTKYMSILLIQLTIHLNSSTKINFSALFVFAGWRHHAYSRNSLDCICMYKIHVYMINTVLIIILTVSLKNRRIIINSSYFCYYQYILLVDILNYKLYLYNNIDIYHIVNVSAELLLWTLGMK